jgi:hypothetical protein
MLYLLRKKNKKAQLDSLELSSSKVPYIRINRDAPARDPYTGFLYAGAPVPQSIEGKDFKEIKIEIGYFDIETQVLQPNEIKIGNVFCRRNQLLGVYKCRRRYRSLL